MFKDEVELHHLVILGSGTYVQESDNVGVIVLAQVSQQWDLSENIGRNSILCHCYPHLLHGDKWINSLVTSFVNCTIRAWEKYFINQIYHCNKIFSSVTCSNRTHFHILWGVTKIYRSSWSTWWWWRWYWGSTWWRLRISARAWLRLIVVWFLLMFDWFTLTGRLLLFHLLHTVYTQPFGSWSRDTNKSLTKLFHFKIFPQIWWWLLMFRIYFTQVEVKTIFSNVCPGWVSVCNWVREKREQMMNGDVWLRSPILLTVAARTCWV